MNKTIIGRWLVVHFAISCSERRNIRCWFQPFFVDSPISYRKVLKRHYIFLERLSVKMFKFFKCFFFLFSRKTNKKIHTISKMHLFSHWNDKYGMQKIIRLLCEDGKWKQRNTKEMRWHVQPHISYSLRGHSKWQYYKLFVAFFFLSFIFRHNKTFPNAVIQNDVFEKSLRFIFFLHDHLSPFFRFVSLSLRCIFCSLLYDVCFW